MKSSSQDIFQFVSESCNIGFYLINLLKSWWFLPDLRKMKAVYILKFRLKRKKKLNQTCLQNRRIRKKGHSRLCCLFSRQDKQT